MNTVSRIAKNTGVIIVGDVLGKMISLLVVIYLARYLGSIGFGKYSFVFAYVSLFRILGDLGIDTIIVREVSRDASKKDIYIGNAVLMKVLLSAFAFISSILVVSALGYPLLTRELVFIYSITLLFAASSPLGDMFQVTLKMEYATFIRITTQVISTVLIFWVIFTKKGLLDLFVLLVLSAFLGVVLTIYYSRAFVKPKFKIDFALWKMILRESWPLALNAVFITIFLRIDVVMLSKMAGDSAVGFYSAAVNLSEAFNIIPSAFMISLFPLMSQYFKTSKEALEKSYELSFKYMMSIIIPIAVGTSILTEPIILSIYGVNFLPSASVLGFLIWAAVFTFAGIVHYNLLISANQQKLAFSLTSTSAILNVILNIILIPRYGFIGAGIATLISYAWGFPLAYFLSQTRPYMKSLFKSSLRPLFSSLVMGLYVVYAYYSLNFHLLLIIGIAAIFYLIILFIVNGITKEDLALFKTILRREQFEDS